MTLPPALRERLAEAVGAVEAAGSVSGDCIGSARRILVSGEYRFLKSDQSGRDGFYAAEAAGLELMRSAGSGLRIPRVVDYRDDQGDWSWIVLDWLDPRAPKPVDWTDLGSGLARLHRANAPTWGWNRDGFIGSLPQTNITIATWPEFWASHRLGPQLDLAAAVGGIGSTAEWSRLLAALPVLLGAVEPEGASLLHGDLWSGNVLFTDRGAALIDPACYYGHREVDLAMAALFGGFSGDFFAAYEATWPLRPGYEVRRKVYQLYYLLVHVNLFGASYASRTAETLRSVLESL